MSGGPMERGARGRVPFEAPTWAAGISGPGGTGGTGQAELLVFERSAAGRRASSFPDGAGLPEVDLDRALPAGARRTGPVRLPEVSERDLVRHYTRLAHRNFAIDLGFYPLGSCTMKYNPKVAEAVANLPGFARLHPAQPAEQVQGALEVLARLEHALCELTGLAGATFQPAAGAHGELTGLLVIRAHHEANGDPRRRVVIPDSAHGTNPASVRMAGFDVTTVASSAEGLVDLDALEAVLDTDVAAFMITNPNTLGLFERDIARVAELVHGAGGQLYYDGANFNAILGKVRPGDMGFDVVHLNLHKTFATPHGGGGPGAGPLVVAEHLTDFLPSPVVARDGDGFRWDHDRPRSIGRVHGWNGNFGIIVRAYAYLLANGGDGLRQVAERAVLNANYLLERLSSAFEPGYATRPVMHEFVLSARRQKAQGARALDLAKALIDRGYHPPTVYFPLIVDEALMVEPTETESVETLDAFADTLLELAAEAETDAGPLREAPVTAPVRRLDEARAARRLVARWHPPSEPEEAGSDPADAGPEEKPTS
ncbi:MAG TPA: aminomethyl-transferring glycine dehydrogenase subunit GcvPB [Actinomycetes bacterium]|jgi:glycine dehydrogenase subunit 2|nr:aminomethyl-transferring glycine dehydrogenase subunit GcvPB [Actinomycetes bacterium]